MSVGKTTQGREQHDRKLPTEQLLITEHPESYSLISK